MALAVTFVTNIGFGESGRRKKVVANLAYTAEAYSSGLSLPKASLGLPNVIESLEFVSATPADTNMYKWDSATSKIRIYEEVSDSYVEVSGNQTVTIQIEALGW